MVELVPVGHDVGVFNDGAGGRVRQVRLGAEVAELSAEEYEMWVSAHDGRVDRGVRVTGTLVDRRLLAEVSDQVAFAGAHRLLPLALGLGNTAEQPWLFSAGLLYEPVVAMTGPPYDLWQWAHLSPDLLAACVEVARAASERPDPEQVLAGVLEAVPSLLSARVACFDVRSEDLR